MLAANNRANAAEARAAEAEVRMEQIAKNHAIAERARIDGAARDRVATAKAVADLSVQLQKARDDADILEQRLLELQAKYDRSVIQLYEAGVTVASREFYAAKQRAAAKLNAV